MVIALGSYPGQVGPIPTLRYPCKGCVQESQAWGLICWGLGPLPFARDGVSRTNPVRGLSTMVGGSGGWRSPRVQILGTHIEVKE